MSDRIAGFCYVDEMPTLKRNTTALLIIDMLNTLDFPEGKMLLKYALPVARNIAKLKARAKAHGIPVIYANDNFGRWRSSWEDVYQACLQGPGQSMAELLKPDADDYFVLKPKHSAFYSTNLDVLLDQLNVETLIMTGIAGNLCVFFTANDAHMREFNVIVPSDCIASNTKRDNDFTLEQLHQVLGKTTVPSSSLRLPGKRKKSKN